MVGVVDEAHEWIEQYVRPTGPMVVTHDRPWAVVAVVPTADGPVWFKRCAPVQAFEPRLTAALASRSPFLLPPVIAGDDDRGWMLLGDAGTCVGDIGNPPDVWLALLPKYAELQRHEAAFANEHVDAGVEDLRTSRLPGRYASLLSDDIPLAADERELLLRFESTFAAWCADLDEHAVASSIQHDDLHHNNVYLRNGEHCILDWGDACVSHPFASLVVTFQFLEDVNGLAPDDAWFARLRDAYLEPWGGDNREAFDLAQRVGTFAHAIAWVRQWRALPDSYRPRFEVAYRAVLRRGTHLAKVAPRTRP